MATYITRAPEALKAGTGKSIEWNIKNNPFIFTDPDAAQQLNAYSTQKYGDGRIPAKVAKIIQDYVTSQAKGMTLVEALRAKDGNLRMGEKPLEAEYNEYASVKEAYENPPAGTTPSQQKRTAERYKSIANALGGKWGGDGKTIDLTKYVSELTGLDFDDEGYAINPDGTPHGREDRIATMQRLGIDEVRGNTAIDDVVLGYNKPRAGNKFAGTNIGLGTVGTLATGAAAGIALGGAGAAGSGAQGAGADAADSAISGINAGAIAPTGAGNMGFLSGIFGGGAATGGGGFLNTVGNIVGIGSGINSIVSGIRNNQAIDKSLADQEAYLGGINNQVQDMQNRWNEIYLPIERDLGQQIQHGVLNPEVEANRAALDVSNEYERGQQIADRNLTRKGIDPSSPRGIANIKKNLNIAEAAARAGAKTNARRNSKLRNFELRNQFLQQGRGLPTSIASQYGGLAQGAQGTLGNINKYGAQGTGNLNPYLSGAGEILSGARDIGLTDWLKNKFGGSGGGGTGSGVYYDSVRPPAQGPQGGASYNIEDLA